MTDSTLSYFPALTGNETRLVQLAEDVRDMGNRVMKVLSVNPDDRHYAIVKLNHAFEQAARALIEELQVDGMELMDEIVRIMEGNR